MSRETKQALWIAAAAAMAIRCWFLFAHRIDSDEPQHLHVSWLWTEGLIAYRDFFDNHLPLLHLLYAPVIAIAPESSAVFPFMRFAIAPFAIGAAALLFAFAKPLFGARVAATAAIVFSLLPPWLARSVEFRNDTLWIFFWLAALALLVRPRGAAWLLAGVAFALSLLASIKAVPLVLAHLLALATLRRGARVSEVMSLAIGAAAPLLMTAAFLFGAGAMDAMLYDTMLFNAAVPVPLTRRMAGASAFVVLAPVTMLRWKRDGAAAHLMLFAFWYVLVLLCFWPVITERDFLPLVPLAAIAIAVHWRKSLAVPIVVAALASVVNARMWRTQEWSRAAFVDAVVQVTAPGEFVFDLKGDAIFRRRPVHAVYEQVTRALTANGTIPDDGPERIVARRCCAAIRDFTHIPPRTRAFLGRHFIGDGPLRVCGTDVRGDTFVIAVPQIYAVVARDPSRVLVDGEPYRAPRYLRAGTHTIARGGNESVRVIWWRAAEMKTPG